jgi:hypothetical protein
MRIAISHTTRYRFDAPARYGVQRLRLRRANARCRMCWNGRWPWMAR